MRTSMLKSNAASLLVFVFFVLVNFCSVETVAFSSGVADHHNSTLSSHGDHHGDKHSEAPTPSHGDNEAAFCCSTVNAPGITTRRVLNARNPEKNSSYVSQPFALLNLSESVNSQKWFHDTGPPWDFLHVSFFLSVFPSHAPPAQFNI